jgi:hypothetical protein
MYGIEKSKSEKRVFLTFDFLFPFMIYLKELKQVLLFMVKQKRWLANY